MTDDADDALWPEPVCSVLIPTRGRPERLLKTVRSCREAFDRPEDVEILLRFDHDDETVTAAIPQLFELGVKIFAGDRRRGYADLHEFYGELSSVAHAHWVWIMNDDAHVVLAEGAAKLTSFFRELGDSYSGEKSHVIVQPEIYGLGGSKYPRCEGGAFPAVPRDVWKWFGHEMPGEAIDTWLDRLLRFDNGWQTVFMPGVTVQHDRDTDDVLEEHRKL